MNQNEMTERLADVRTALIAFAEAFQKAYAESIERAIKFWNGLNELMCEIDEKKNGQMKNRQRVAGLLHVRSHDTILIVKRMSHQVNNRTPMYPVKKII